ncbi:MAG: transcriptional regulator, TetR family [Actinomycetia bacterium]|nr:transcriptional regulator, TetR family [Actinomycetes bacterium]
MNGAQPVELDVPQGGVSVHPAVEVSSDPGVAPTIEPSDDTVVDGRSARSAKTRDAIADALLDLLTDRTLRPTAKEIAQRAGVSVRSVYVHFDDLEDLFCVAANRHFTRIAPMLTPVPATGTLSDRAHALVRQRVRLYAKIGAVGRATRLHAESSPTLARIVRDAQSRSRLDIQRVFARELGTMTADDGRKTVAVLDLLTSADAWQTLRVQNDLDVETARRCLADAIVVQLGAGAR